MLQTLFNVWVKNLESICAKILVKVDGTDDGKLLRQNDHFMLISSSNFKSS